MNANRTHRTKIQPHAAAADAHAVRAGQMFAEQMDDLRKMRAEAMALSHRIVRYAQGTLTEAEKPAFKHERNAILSFARVSRAVRQIIVLEQEIMGVRALPEHRGYPVYEADATKKREKAWMRAWPIDDPVDHYDRREPDDYNHGPYEDVVAEVRATIDDVSAAFAPRKGSAAKALPKPTPRPSSPDLIRRSTSYSDAESDVDAPIKSGHDGIENDYPGGHDPP